MTDARQLISYELLQQIEEAARVQHRKPSDVLEDAVKQYFEEQSWQALVGRADERNRAKGLTEDDVPRVVSELRLENRERGR